MKKIIYLALIISLISVSCSIEKRVYNSGYHVTWNNGKHNIDKNEFLTNHEITETESVQQNDRVSDKISKDLEKETSIESTTVNDETFSANQPKNEIFSKNIEHLKKSKSKKSNKEKNKFSTQKEVKKILKAKEESNSDDKILHIILIVILVILIIFLLSLLGGLLGGLLSLLLLILIIYFILKMLGSI